MSYDPSNVFAKILRGEIPAFKIYEDAETFAFLDIMPRTTGHALVIPKSPCRNALDASPAQLTACLLTVQKVARAAMAAFGAPGVKIEQYNEPASGQTVFHLHYHVLPCWDGVPLGPPGQMGDMEKIKAHAGVLAGKLAGG
ncbi:MAG: HIT domain-containing protein [Hyphomicrobiaceae bacterium]